MNAYVVYLKDCPEYGAALVFAQNGNEARKHGYRYLQWLGDADWCDVVTDNRAGETAAFAAQEGIDLRALTGTHVVRHPKGCARCECVAATDNDGLCLSCSEEEE